MIRLLVLDVDGVLSHGEAAPFDFTVLQRLAAYNDQARADVRCPAVTLCTGRPAPYVEVLMQLIHGYYPAVYENGAGLYVPAPYGFHWHPDLPASTQARLLQLQALLHAALVTTQRAILQPGKSASLSVFPRPQVSLQRLYEETSHLVSTFDATFVAEVSATCVNVILRGLDKAAGVSWLARQTGIALHAMAGVGDSPGDVAFLQLMGWCGAPANAHEAVKAIAHYTSPYEDSAGLLDILRYVPALSTALPP